MVQIPAASLISSTVCVGCQSDAEYWIQLAAEIRHSSNEDCIA